MSPVIHIYIYIIYKRKYIYIYSFFQLQIACLRLIWIIISGLWMPWCSSRHQVRSYCCQSVRQMVLCKPFVRWTVSQPERWPWDPGKFYTTGSSNIAVAGKWRPRIESMYFLLNIGIFQPAMLAFSLPEGNILNPKVMEVDGFRWFSFFNLGSFRRSIFRGAKGGNPTMKGFFLGELKPWKPFLKVVTLKVAERHHFLWVNPTTFSSFWVTFCLGETTPSIELWATTSIDFAKGFHGWGWQGNGRLLVKML